MLLRVVFFVFKKINHGYLLLRCICYIKLYGNYFSFVIITLHKF